MPSSSRRLGEILVDKKLLSQWQLMQALEEQSRTKEFLGAILIRYGWVSEEALFNTLAEQFEMQYIHIDEKNIDWAVSRRFSPELLLKHHCFPLQMNDDVLTVAIANPLDVWAIAEFEREAGNRYLDVFLAPEREIKSAIEKSNQKALKDIGRENQRT